MRKPLLSELSLREKIGQTAVARPKFVDGPDTFKKYPYGAIWLARGNNDKFDNLGEDQVEDPESDFPKKYDLWLKEANKNMPVPILAAMDAAQGGAKACPGMSFCTTAAGVGATRSEELARELFECIGREAIASGNNWIWSPVADQPSPFCSVMVGRSLTSDLDLCARLLCAEIDGLQSSGVAAAVKHFPGADKNEYRDDHVSPCEITDASFEEWFDRQGVLFQKAIDHGVYSVMVAHESFPAIDDTRVVGGYIPCTLSKKVITNLLKEKMGFKGVVVTDSVAMRSVLAVYGEEKMYIEMLKAGNDMILGPVSENYFDIVEQAVLSGELDEARIDDACQRVLDMKEKIGLFDKNHVSGGGITNEIREATHQINRRIAENSLTMICNDNHLVPVSRKDVKKVKIIFSGYADAVFENLNYMKAAFEARGAEVSIQRRVGPEIKEIAKEYDLIVYAAHLGPHAPRGGSAFFTDEYDSFLFALTEGKEKSIGVSFGSQYIYYDYFTNAPAFVNAYGANRESMEVFVEGLYGECEWKGQSPFPLNPQR